MERDYPYYRELLRGRRLPLAFCDLDLFDTNAAAITERAHGMPVRVASKSIRCRTLLERVLARPGYRGVMCFSAGEAAFLAAHGLDDLLVAYPTVEKSEIAEVAEQVGAGRRITLMVDDAAQVEKLGAMARAHGQVLDLAIDVDMSSSLPGLHFGVRRSPIRTADRAVALARRIGEEEGLGFGGVMGYEAQIAGIPDAVPGKAVLNLVVRALKRRSIRELTRRRGAVVEALGRAGFEPRFVNGGGTGSIESTIADPSVTEVTAGSGLYSPSLFDGFQGFRHLPAMGFAVPVTRRPAADIYTCHGGGYVASGAAGGDKLPAPYLPRGARLLDHEGAGEVQTPIAYSGARTLEIGDPVLLRHAKAGELCERFESVVLIAKGEVTGEVATYRGEGRSFL